MEYIKIFAEIGSYVCLGYVGLNFIKLSIDLKNNKSNKSNK